MMILDHYSPYLQRMGKKFSRIAAVDASLIKLSLQAYDWATYRKQTGAAKITCVFDWMQGVPKQFVFNASGKVHDLQATIALTWRAGWTYLFDRGYFSFDLLTVLLNASAHFVIRFKRGVAYRIVKRFPIPDVKLPAGIREITSDWLVKLPGWDGEALLRMVSYKLTDGKLIRVLTSRHDLSALSIAQLYKEDGQSKTGGGGSSESTKSKNHWAATRTPYNCRSLRPLSRTCCCVLSNTAQASKETCMDLSRPAVIWHSYRYA